MTTRNNTHNTLAETALPRSSPMLQAYYETEAVIPPNHHLVLDVPANVPAGPVRLAIIYQTPDTARHIASQGIKSLLLTMPDVGNDDDFARRQDLGRGDIAWDS